MSDYDDELCIRRHIAELSDDEIEQLMNQSPIEHANETEFHGMEYPEADMLDNEK